jgi:hypothetical protein
MKRALALTLLIAVSALVLAACGVVRSSQISQMDARTIQTASDKELCNPYANGQVVSVERQRRGLGDCSAAGVACIQNGYAAGTPGYLNCRQVAIQQEAVDAQRWNNVTQAGIAMMQANQPPPPPPPPYQSADHVCIAANNTYYRC